MLVDCQGERQQRFLFRQNEHLFDDKQRLRPKEEDDVDWADHWGLPEDVLQERDDQRQMVVSELQDQAGGCKDSLLP